MNKEIFKQSRQVLALIVSNRLIHNFSKEFKGHLIIRPCFKSIIPLESDDSKKIILLNEKISNDTEIPDNLQSFIKSNEIEVVKKTIDLDYKNFTYEQVLKTVLPENITIPHAFERIGHIAHLNLRDEQLPYKHLIGQAILDKNLQVKTVLNKVGKIDTVFRTFQIEVLAGEDNLVTEVKENECLFKFNFSEVYWNSRLQYEHFNLIDTFKSSDTICDMFAGVGPFACPAVKLKKCTFYANDLNPNSVKYMKENANNNKIDTTRLFMFNLDAREFVRDLLYPKEKSKKPVPFNHVIMNLPSTSIEFLDVFRDIFLDPNQNPPIPPPMIHCYTFTKNTEDGDLVESTRKNVEKVLNYKIPDDFTCFEVRDVSPNKRMMRISFVMPNILPYIGEEIVRVEVVDPKKNIKKSSPASIATTTTPSDSSTSKRTSSPTSNESETIKKAKHES
ncbi:hypothetical protein CYY_003692 [Polysphondylium violaceum]|uniref:tRNA (guanine(37)-N1)-methyltransferase n=1 Tax=Polysphondylium violaceum TaxID=133409 RepID=A0A8J4Q6I1_9MYCE|nr:hypothetical protein CYY_003692 [Polysphondylium violaceum]